MYIPEEKRAAVEKLVAYIPFFENAKQEDVCHWQTAEMSEDGTMPMTYPTYCDEFIAFIETAYNEDLLDSGYIDTMNAHTGGETELETIIYGIENADYRLTMAVFTCIVRQEMYCYGLWAMAVRDRWFLLILQHLEELLED